MQISTKPPFAVTGLRREIAWLADSFELQALGKAAAKARKCQASLSLRGRLSVFQLLTDATEIMMSLVGIFAAASLLQYVSAFSSDGFFPQQTQGLGNDAMHLGWTPAPTSAPLVGPAHDWLHKRADSSVCGYISGSMSMAQLFPNEPKGRVLISADNPITCAASSICAFETNINAFGCCASDLGSASAAGCSYFTTCLDSTVGCDRSCQSDPAAAYW